MNDPLRIRFATATDAQAIAEFNIAMALETEGKRLEPEVVFAGVETLIADPDGGFYLVAQLGGKVVGCLLVTFEWSDWRNGRFWWIQSVYVHPDQRRRGVFRGLYMEVLKLARERGRGQVCGLRLYVEQDNQIAQQTYRQLGMVETPYRIYEQEFDARADTGAFPEISHDA